MNKIGDKSRGGTARPARQRLVFYPPLVCPDLDSVLAGDYRDKIRVYSGGLKFIMITQRPPVLVHRVLRQAVHKHNRVRHARIGGVKFNFLVEQGERVERAVQDRLDELAGEGLVLSALKPAAFQKCFQEWIAACLLCNNNDTHRTIAIDGKTMRRSRLAAGPREDEGGRQGSGQGVSRTPSG